MSCSCSSWLQRVVSLKARPRGCHYITDEIQRAVPEMKNYKVGNVTLCLQHTSASICLNENWDRSVLKDAEMLLNHIVPQKGLPYTHTLEGPDDMPAHIKSALIGATLSLPVTDGRLNLGTWQGIWLCEHRDRAGGRNVVVTLNGQLKKSDK